MQDANARQEAIHQTYEQQVADLDTSMLDQLYARISALADNLSAGAVRVQRDGRALTLTDSASARRLHLVMDDVLDLPEAERPGPFRMGNARVTVNAWDGTTRQWLLRNVAADGMQYQWVTLPGDVRIDDGVLTALLGGLQSGQVPPDPAETVHVSTAAADPTGRPSDAGGQRWAIYNLYSQAMYEQGGLFSSADEAATALTDMVRSGQAPEGNWEVRPIA